MRFEYCVEPDTAFGNHHLHFYLEYPTSTSHLVSNTLLKFVGADCMGTKNRLVQTL